MEGASTSGAALTQRKHPSFRIRAVVWRRWEFSEVPGRLEEVLEEAFMLPDEDVRMAPRIRALDLWELGCRVRGHRLLIVGSWSATQGWRVVYSVHDLGTA